MSLKDTLTNEQLTDRFENPFALVNHAILLAKAALQRGEGLETNPVNDVLETIALNRDQLKDLESTVELEENKEAV